MLILVVLEMLSLICLVHTTYIANLRYKANLLSVRLCVQARDIKVDAFYIYFETMYFLHSQVWLRRFQLV